MPAFTRNQAKQHLKHKLPGCFTGNRLTVGTLAYNEINNNWIHLVKLGSRILPNAWIWPSGNVTFID